MPHYLIICHIAAVHMGFRTKIFMELFNKYTICFFHLPPTSSHHHPLQVKNCHNNSKLVLDEDYMVYSNDLYFLPPPPLQEPGSEEGEDDDNLQLCPCLPCCPPIRTAPPSTQDIQAEGGAVNWLKFILRWVIYIPAFPFVVIFSWTIPDCSKDHTK